MLLHPPIKSILFALLITLVATTGCIYPRKVQPGKPFVYKTNINIQGNLTANQKQDMKGRLENQLDDSLKTKEVTIAPFIKNLVRPPVFDTSAAIHSQEFMKALLYSLGYYKAEVTWDSSLVVKKSATCHG
jgi:outer membrane protein insertion porin family